MIKISNLLKAMSIIIGLTWALYGTGLVARTNVEVRSERSEPSVRTGNEPRMELVRVQLGVPPAKKARYPEIDLTKVPSRTRTVSTPLKSDIGLP